MKKNLLIMYTIIIANLLSILSCTTNYANINNSSSSIKDNAKSIDLSGYQTDFSKRGICYNKLNSTVITEFANGNVTWAYNWGIKSEFADVGSNKKLDYLPMMWGRFSESDINDLENYFIKNDGTKILLGFNEPMMTNKDGGCALSPEEAAKLWPKLEALAKKYNVKLASPALTYGYEEIQGTVYSSPEKWMDSFISTYHSLYNDNPHYDYIALHSYMNWPSAVIFYVDKYAQMYNKPVLLTEFCAWGNNSDPWDNIQSLENEKFPDYSFQQRTMTQKVEALDKDKNVAGYAWFMADAETNSIIINNALYDKQKLTTLGKVYTYMSNGENDIFYSENKIIPAVQYVASSNYNPEATDPYDTFLLFDSNSDTLWNKSLPLEIQGFIKDRFVIYQLDVPETTTYTITLRLSTNKDFSLKFITQDNKTTTIKIPSTNSEWADVNVEVNLTVGKQRLKILNSSSSAQDVKLNYLTFFKKDSYEKNILH